MRDFLGFLAESDLYRRYIFAECEFCLGSVFMREIAHGVCVSVVRYLYVPEFGGGLGDELAGVFVSGYDAVPGVVLVAWGEDEDEGEVCFCFVSRSEFAESGVMCNSWVVMHSTGVV